MNPYEQFQASNPMLVPQSQIDEVDGEGGAKALTMGPNSGRLALDKNNPILYVIRTDNLGNKVLIASYDLTPHIPEPDPAVKALNERMNNIESKFETIMSKLTSFEEALK